MGHKFGITISRLESDDEVIKNMNVGSFAPKKPIAKLVCKNCGQVYYLYRKGKVYQRKGLYTHCGRCKGELEFIEM